MPVLALDLGGTKLAAGVFSAEGEILGREVTPLAGRGARAVGALLSERAAALRDEVERQGGAVAAVGVAVPGIAHAERGTVWAPNIAGWDDYPLGEELAAALGPLPIAIDSDRACCIAGEAWRGAARGCRDAVFLTVGTGIGAGLLCDGRILRGQGDVAGAIGWLALDRPHRPEYAPCGCFEHHASGEGLARVARELLAGDPGYRGALREVDPAALTAHDLFRAFDAGDPLAARVVDNAVSLWGMAIANLVSLLNPQRVVLGGGLFGPAARLLDRIREEALRWAQPIAFRQVRIELSQLGADAALHGAARLALLAAGGERP